MRDIPVGFWLSTTYVRAGAANEYSPPGAISCSACPSGRAAPSGSASCETCDSNEYVGDGGQCFTCVSGQYLLEGTTCVDCNEGTFSNSPGATHCACCATNFYADKSGSTTCSAAKPGFYVADASTDTDGTGVTSCARALVPCPPGTITSAETGEYSFCTPCAAGKYATDSASDSDGQGVPSAASACAACPSGRTSTGGSYECSMCSAGTWASTGSSECALCDAGYYGIGGDVSSSCTGPCAAGYRGEAGATSSLCSGVCEPGYFCEAGTPAGNEKPCGAASVYCPKGSEMPIRVSDGFYTTPISANESRREGQAVCERGTYCVDGVRSDCPAGRFGDATGLQDSTCSGECIAGYYCTTGSTTATATMCGLHHEVPASVWCDEGSVEPIATSVGNYTTPYWGSMHTRTGVAACLTNENGELLEYCPGDGFRHALAHFDSCPSASELSMNEKTANVVISTVRASSKLDQINPMAVSYGLYRNGHGFDFTRRLVSYENFENTESTMVSLSGDTFIGSTSSYNGDYSVEFGSNQGTAEIVASFRDASAVTYAFAIRPVAVDDDGTYGLMHATLTRSSTGATTLCSMRLSKTILICTCGIASVSVERPPINANQWTHVAIVVDGHAGEMLLAINAIVVAKSSLQYSEEDYSLASLTVGESNDGASIQASFDDLAIFSTGLVDAELETVSQGGLEFAGQCNVEAIKETPLIVNSTSGAITSLIPLDARLCKVFTITVNATTPPFERYSAGSAFCVFRVTVVDVNDSPSFSSPRYNSSVIEFSPVNMLVGNPLADSVTDPDQLQAILFSLPKNCSDNHLGLFGIGACTGQLFVAKNTIDFQLFQAITLCVEVRDDDVDEPLTARAEVLVTVVNVNDPPVLITEDPTSCVVDENVLMQSLLVPSKLDVFDPDGDPISWSIDDPNGVVTIDGDTGLLRTARANLNYEETSYYGGIRVTATDGELASTVYISLTVSNANDEPVCTTSADIAVEVPENSEPGTIITSLATFCSDEDATDVLTYSFDSVSPFGTQANFSIYATSGTLVVGKGAVLDYESDDNDYIVQFKVTDGTIVKRYNMNVAVTDENEAPSLLGGKRWSVYENASIGTVIGSLQVQDPDLEDNSFTWSLVNDTREIFNLVTISEDDHTSSTMAWIVLRKGLNFETNERHAVQARVVDRGLLSDTKTFFVDVMDVNEQPTLAAFDSALFVYENEPIGTKLNSTNNGVYLLRSSVGDPDCCDTFTYAVYANAEVSDIDTRIIPNYGDSSGLQGAGQAHLVTNATFDYESDGKILSLWLVATDSGHPALSSAPVSLVVTVLDVNEAPITHHQRVSVSDMLAVGDVIAVLEGSDPEDDDLTYHTVAIDDDSHGIFGISGDTVIALSSLQNWLQYRLEAQGRSFMNETTASASTVFLFWASDGSFNSSRSNLTVKVIHQASQLRLGRLKTNFTVLENAPTGTLVGGIVAQHGESAQIAYSIHGGTGKRLFTINTTSGEIATLTPLNFEERKMYTLEIQVTDGVATDSDTFYVWIIDQPDRPSFVYQQLELFVAEDAEPGVITGQRIIAVDEDSDEQRTLKYSLDFAHGYFSIRTNETDGHGELVLEAGASLDYETKDTYEGYVTVADATGFNTSSRITVHVIDVNSPPVFTMASATGVIDLGFVPEKGRNSDSGFINLGNLGILDEEGDALVYNLTGGDGRFTIAEDGPNRGSLIVKEIGLDFENTTSYNLSVTVSEASTIERYSASATVQVSVIDVNDITFISVSPSIMASRGGDIVTIRGTNLGPQRPADSAATIVAATYSNGVDGAVYHASDCRITEAGVEIKCVADEGVGRKHVWNVTIEAPHTHKWSATTTYPIAPEDLMTSYEAPTISGVYAAAPLETGGGTLISITGSGFAPYCAGTFCADSDGKACRGTCVDLEYRCHYAPYEGINGSYACASTLADSMAITFGRNRAGVEFICSNVRVATPGTLNIGEATNMTCTAGAGFGGSPLYWQISVGVREAEIPADVTNFISESWESSLSFAAPSIARVEVEGIINPANLKTSGGQVIKIFGQNFGASSTSEKLTVSYGNPPYDAEAWYVADGCEVTVDHIEITCMTAQGVGANFNLIVTRSGLASETSSSSISYAPPRILPLNGALNAASGGGAKGSATTGGEVFYLTGENFGTSNEDMLVTYGPTPYANTYVAANCFVKIAHTMLQCETVEGTGFAHSIAVTIAGQRSDIYLANISYDSPFISFYTASWDDVEDRDGALAVGGEQVYIHGGNFGPSSTPIEAVFYGEGGANDYVACDTYNRYGGMTGHYTAAGANLSVCACSMHTAHTVIGCKTVPATGTSHVWHVVIDGQLSSTPTTNTEAPSIDRMSGYHINASQAGGQTVYIYGENFGRSRAKLEAVSYGPSGVEFEPRNCSIMADGLLRCETTMGIGTDLQWVVTVDGQTSEVSNALFSYAEPVIYQVTPRTGSTKGGTTHVIRGRNLGLEYASSTLRLFLDNNAVPFDGTDLIEITLLDVKYRYWCSEENRSDTKILEECVSFILPEMLDMRQAKTIAVQVSSSKYTSLAMGSNKLSFTYESPVITSVLSAESSGSTELVIGGKNFGVLGKVFVNGEEQVSSDHSHDRVKLVYEGVSGTIVVVVGESESNEWNFTDNSPRIITDIPEYLPDPGGYRTSGLDENDERGSITILGYYFSGSVNATEVYVGDIRAEIVAIIDDVPNVQTSTNVGYGAVLRALTFRVPAGTGSSNAITVFVNGRPSFVGDPAKDILHVSYLPPSVKSISPSTIPTQGGTLVIDGENFGSQTIDATVSIGGVVCPQLSLNRSHTSMSIVVPPGEGTSKTLIILVADQETLVRNAVSYGAPVIDSIRPSQIETLGESIRILGSNLGRAGKQEVWFMSHFAPKFSIVNSDADYHSWIDIELGPGQGINRMVVNVSNQLFVSSIAYRPPCLKDLSPSTADTKGGTELQLQGSHFGIGQAYVLEISGSGVHFSSLHDLVVTRFANDKITLLSPTGQAGGPLAVTLKTCADATMDETTCTKSAGNLTFNFSAPKIYFIGVPSSTGSYVTGSLRFDPLFGTCYFKNGRTCVNASCNRYSEAGCGLPTSGTSSAYDVAIVGENFGTQAPKISFGGQEIQDVRQPINDDERHEVVYFLVPPGSGTGIEVAINISYLSASTTFSYDPPYISYVTPNTPDGTGETIQIHGKNFGETSVSAGVARILIDGLVCSRTKVGTAYLDIWNDGGGVPYLLCTTPEVTVGPKSINVTVAQQTTYYSPADGKISFKCGNSHYGQTAGTIYVTDAGYCEDECDLEEGETCGTVQSPNGIINCALITRHDEYCLPCPIGSRCLAQTSITPVEPISLAGYYRLDLRDTEYDVACSTRRTHRDIYCYKFEPCSPSKACEGNNTCAKGYTGTKCAHCCDVSESHIVRNGKRTKNPECHDDDGVQLLFYRRHGECVECPTNFLLVACLVVAVVLASGIAVYVLKKKKVDMAVVAIGIDYLQVLSLFASADVKWPNALQVLYSSLSVFSFNFLNVFPPQCSISVPYKKQWLAIQFAPMGLALCLYAAFVGWSFYLRIAYKYQAHKLKIKLKRAKGHLTSCLL